MFIEKYVKPMYWNIICNNYEEFYLNSFDESNFKKVYEILKDKGFNYIEDIILDYLELFEIEYKYVDMALDKIQEIIGDDYVSVIGKNMYLIDKVIDIAYKYSEEDL